MRKLSELPFNESMDALAKILTPVANIATSEDIKHCGAKNKLEYLQAIISTHKEDCGAILAALNGTSPAEYMESSNFPSLAKDFLELLNDETFVSFFISVGQKKD